MKGATDYNPYIKYQLVISIHAPREGSDLDNIKQEQGSIISIHAPREGSDGNHVIAFIERQGFQSTLPVKGATVFLPVLSDVAKISIHAPREGSDGLFLTVLLQSYNFNPRSP